jgi:hypothetical protein
MGVNLGKMADRAKSFKAGGSGEDKKDNLFAKVTKEPQVFRMLEVNGDAWETYHLHYLTKNGKTIASFLCPRKNFGEDCPVCDWATELFQKSKETGDETMKRQAIKMFANQRWYSPVLVRGKEEDGPRIWSYSKTVAAELTRKFTNPDYGDLTDSETGTDLTVFHATAEGKLYPDTVIDPRRMPSKLAETAEEVQGIMSSIPNIMEQMRRLTRDEIQEKLDESLGLNDAPPVEKNATQTPKGEDQPSSDPEADEIDRKFAELDEV